jgi:hypothetical protein
MNTSINFKFFECEKDKNEVERWSHYECPEGEGYDPHQEDCSSSYQCGAICQVFTF